MRITRLEADNVKRLRAVRLDVAGDAVVVIRGENAQGKSSVLDAIAMALGGKNLQPPEVIRRGEDNARVLLDLDEMVVERRWTSNDHSTLEVRSKEGARFPSPQGMLDKLVGRLSFDPMAFLRLDAHAQAKALRELLNVDFTLLDQQRAKLYEERTVTNRMATQARARVQGKPKPVGPPPSAIDVAKLLADQSRALSLKSAAVAAEATAKRAGEIFAEAMEDLARLRKEVAEAEITVDREKANSEAAAMSAMDADEAVSAGPDRIKIEQALAQAGAVNQRIADHLALVKSHEEAEAYESNATAITEKIDEVDAQKAGMLKAAKFPVPGLAFAEAGVTLNDLPLEQASQAEKLRVSVAMGLALNPRLKVLLVRDASLLDAFSMKAIAEMAEAAGAQVWLEVVGKEGVGVVIEDGAIEGAEVPAETAKPRKGGKKT